MQAIDLGDELQIKIKYKGVDYILREPTFGEVEKLQGDEVNKINLPEFLSGMGMPIEIVRAMGMSKVKALVDGIMDMVTKKK